MPVMQGETKQAYKYRINLAGEFLVAGELMRRGARAGVTMGNAKRADVVALVKDRAKPVEVKTTETSEFMIGSDLPLAGELWTLVRLPSERDAAPEFYILKGEELRAILQEQHDTYDAGYIARHGRSYTGRSVHKVSSAAVAPFRDQWGKILGRIRPA